MLIGTGLLLLGVAGFLAYVVRGITGGASAIAFNALFGLEVAFGLAGGLTLLDGIHWVALSDLVTGLVLFVALRGQIHAEPFLVRFLIVSLPLNVLATLLLPSVDLWLLTVSLGLTLVGAGGYLVVRRAIGHWDDATLHRRALPMGAAAGVLGGLFGMAGPVSVVYLIHAGGTPSQFRARLTFLSVFWGVSRVATLVLSGAIGASTVGRFALTLPLVLGGLALGYRLHPRVSADAFRIGLGIMVAGSGALLVVRTIAG
ncbi:MAG: TSUP family transporter [Chloroflexota bacterium]